MLTLSSALCVCQEAPAKPFRPAYERVSMGDLHKLSKPKPEPRGEPKLELVKDKRAGDRHLQDAAPVSIPHLSHAKPLHSLHRSRQALRFTVHF